jgi:hypothetical protein
MSNFDRASRHLFWLLQTGGWLLLMVLSVSITLILFSDALTVLILGVFRQVLGFVLSLGLWRIYRRWPATGFRLTQHVPAIIMACIGATILDLALTEAIRLTFDGPVLPDTVRLGAVFIRLLIYGTWSSLYFGFRQEIESRAAAARHAEAIMANREAELQLLRAQLNPDFFLNALNTVIAEARAGNTATVLDATQGVAGYLGYALNQGIHTHYAPLGGELDAVSGYLRVEGVRLGAGQLEWQIDASKEARKVTAPTMLLQPLVENAVKYGLRTSPTPLRISIEVWVVSGELVIVIENTGRWLDPSPGETAGLSLDNLRRRLKLLYDQLARFKVTTPEGCVRIEVRVPVAGVCGFPVLRYGTMHPFSDPAP